MVTRPSPVPLTCSRRIAADPTSLALLLAGPAALELWPGVRRVAEVGERVLVETDLASGDGRVLPVAAVVAAAPPRRTPTAFVAHFSWTSSVLPPVEGALTLSYAPGANGTPSTTAVLRLDVGQAFGEVAVGDRVGYLEPDRKREDDEAEGDVEYRERKRVAR